MANLLTYGLPVIFTVLCVVAFVIYYCKKHCRSKHSQRINKKRRNVDEIWKKRERTSRVFYSLCLLILTPIAFVFWVNAIIVICEKMGSGATIFYSPIGYADSFLSIVGLGSAILIAFFQYRIQCKFEERTEEETSYEKSRRKRGFTRKNFEAEKEYCRGAV